ncbi:uncharacterized protein C2orf81 homolog isoform X1 [Hoplias malabaricus]|uniref:uncharacterized protein C2orf81 homolog isoform X1 n=2 Tax=Hoplias malabaricus TaxID=27720 RepID=UPI003462296E
MHSHCEDTSLKEVVRSGTMSRATSKNRAEKGRATPAQPPPHMQTPVPVDIVPGYLSESDWLSMISQQEGEDVVADIVEELVDSVTEKCYKLYLEKQLVPFTVVWARDAMVQVIKCQYLMRDDSDEPTTILDVKEDAEPLPSVTDSWAEGCVPVIRIAKSSQQGCRFDGQELDINYPLQKQRCQSMKKTESPQREPRGDRKRSGRAVKLIPAAQASLEVQRKPHPPEIPSRSRLKASKGHYISQCQDIPAEENLERK